jgi:CRISPR-associated endonuclease Csn1
MAKNYNIGLDIGTSSVGWAVVEEDTQKIIRKGKNKTPLWGVRLFEKAETAEERRNYRSTRRRYDRRRERIRLLQEEFKEEINIVDSNFYNKLKESKYNKKDLVNKTIIIEKEEQKLIKEYNNKYPTIYHLRNKLINSNEKEDIRLVYLAIHHIIKYRGHFNYPGEHFSVESLDLKEKLFSLFNNLIELVPELEINESYNEIITNEIIEESFLNVSKNDMKVKTKELLTQLTTNNKFISEYIKLLSGAKFSVKKLFNIEVESEEDLSITFRNSDYDDNYEKLEKLLSDKIEILSQMKELYDTIFLKKLFSGSNSTNLSGLMVERYNQHKEDLRFLKKLFDNERKDYNKLFRDGKDKCIYNKYITNEITNEEFIKEIQKYLPDVLESYDKELINKYNTDIKFRMDNGTFMPRITETENGKYPYQLNEDELVKIIEKQGKYYNFLLEKIDGKYKIVKLLEFKIPYYVGPLNKNSQFAWLKKNSDEKITPYNFDKIIDKENTAEEFIKRMISHCTYLNDKVDENGNIIEVNYALPNCSILYSKFKVMNELKQIKINGDSITVENQNKIFNELFLKTPGTITEKKFKDYLKVCPDYYALEGEFNITGYSADGKFANNMQSYIDFFGEDGIFNNTNYNENDAEQIIEWITIFEDNDILKSKVVKNYNQLSDNSIKKVLNKRYSGWGNLSRKLLCGIVTKDKKSGVGKTIMDYMHDTKENFMQIINNDEYKFQELIAEYNKLNNGVKFNYGLVENLATSPATKRGIYQALKIVDEITKYIGYNPKNIMIEMAREEQNTGRKDDRKTYLEKLYKENASKIEKYNTLISELDNQEKINTEKLYLYFIQEGKCLYTGTPINIDELNNDKYEVDHIIPRTLIKDDSIDNKALVLRTCNQTKKDSFVLPQTYRNSMRNWWEHLKTIKLISAKKFNSLTRTKYSDEDIQGFINRQLVETRQITKHVADILGGLYPKTKIVYLKANLSHNYRERYELFKFREINDYHHAHDAYLAAVLGEYKEKYMKKKIDFEAVKELNKKFYENGDYNKLKYGFVINCLDENEFDIVNKITKNFINEETGEALFDVSRFNKIVENTLYRNDILISKKTEIRTGQYYDQTKKKKCNDGIKLKDNMPIEMYGAYTSVNPSYAVMIEYEYKNEIKQRMVGMPIFVKDDNDKINYLKNKLNIKDNQELKIMSKPIPFYAYLNWNNQLCYLVGASDKVEVVNAKQFNYDKEFYKKHKYTLLKIFNNRNYKINEIQYDKELSEIIKYIVDKIDKEYELYKNLIPELKIITKYNENFDFSIENKEKIIVQLTNLLNCKSVNANFKFLDSKYSSAFGKKNGRIIEKCNVINTSTTAIKQVENEL